MAKPILVIRVDNAYSDSFYKISKGVRKQIKEEYHVLVAGHNDCENPIFEVFNVDKEPEIKYSELKKLINKETI